MRKSHLTQTFAVLFCLGLSNIGNAESILSSTVNSKKYLPSCGLDHEIDHEIESSLSSSRPRVIDRTTILREKNVVGWSQVGPSLMVDFDRGEQVINLSREGESGKGFRITRHIGLEIGVGPSASYWFNPATTFASGLVATVGVVPVVGVSATRVAHVPTREATRAQLSRRVPNQAVDLEAWANGDRLTYATTGGIGFFANVGFVGVSVSVAYVAKGKFEVDVLKTAPQRAIVRISDIKIRSLSSSAGAIIASLEASKYREKAKAFSYELDLSSEIGRHAYEDLVRGNIAPVQLLAMANQTEAVKPYESAQALRLGKNLKLKFGVPFLLNASTERGQVYELSNEETHWNSSRAVVNHGLFVRDTHTEFAGDDTLRVRAFSSTSIKVTDQNGTSDGNVRVGRFIWRLQKDSATSADIRRSLKEVERRTGLVKLSSMHVPSVSDVGYGEVEMRLTLTPQINKNLIEQSNSRANLVDRGLTRMHEYFKAGDLSEVCLDYVGPASPGDGKELDNPFSRLERCKSRIEASTKGAVKDMHAALEAIRSAPSEREAVLRYVDFGKAMMENRFTFLVGLELAGDDAHVDLSIAGEFLPRSCTGF